MRTRDEQIRIAKFFSDKSKARFRETGSYACEHATDLRNSECAECLAADKKPALSKKPDLNAVSKRARAAVRKRPTLTLGKKKAKKKRG